MREGLKASPFLTSSVFCSSHDYQSETTFYSAGMSLWERFGSPFRITSGSLLDHLATPHRPFFAKNTSPYLSSGPTRVPPVPTPPRLENQGTPYPIKHDAQAALSQRRLAWARQSSMWLNSLTYKGVACSAKATKRKVWSFNSPQVGLHAGSGGGSEGVPSEPA